MSEPEQHEIIGRTMVELGEAKRRLATLEVKARAYAECMRIVGQDLLSVGTANTGSGFSGVSLVTAFERYPDKIEVVALADELRVTKAKIESLSNSLREMGV